MLLLIEGMQLSFEGGIIELFCTNTHSAIHENCTVAVQVLGIQLVFMIVTKPTYSSSCIQWLATIQGWLLHSLVPRPLTLKRREWPGAKISYYIFLLLSSRCNYSSGGAIVIIFGVHGLYSQYVLATYVIL